MAKIVEFEWTIPLVADEDSKNLTMSVSVDAPQVGKSLLEMPDGKMIKSPITEFDLGTVGYLRGKTLYCDTTVTDFSTENNATKVNFQVGDHTITYPETVDTHGASIQYQVTIIFK